MRPFITLVGLVFLPFITIQAQPDRLRQPIPELPFISWEEAGFNQDSIESLLNQIYDTPPNDFRGLVVIKSNQIVLEEYFNTFWRTSIHDIRSAGKSITALLLGIAIKEGLINDLNQDLYSFFPNDKYPTINEDYKKIKLRHLMNMASGLDADTDRPQTPGHAVNWIAKADWKEYILNIPLASAPGEKWVYADINPLLIAAVIEEKSGMSLKDYAEQKLFAPLGITQSYWYTNAANQTGAAGNLYLSTLDFAKLGVLVFNKGRWENKQLIDPAFIKELFVEAHKLPGEYSLAETYSMFWYKNKQIAGGKILEYIFASGNGGNHLVVIPSEEIVIALTSSAYGQRYAHRRSYNIMRKVLRAMK